MGVNGILPRILSSAGRENYDLRALSDGLISRAPSSTSKKGNTDVQCSVIGHSPAKKKRKWTRRKFRVAVDVNGWLSRAAHGYGGNLLDERHLSYHGRAELRDERLQQQQQQQLEEEGKQPEDEDDEEQPANNNSLANNDNNQTTYQSEEQQKAEYIHKCIAFVLTRIEFLRNECSAMVLPVLDGATPPCKLEVVRERSNKRKRAVEQRDQVAQSPSQRPTHHTGARAEEIANELAAAGEEEEHVDDNEASRTEAEVLRRISASRRAGTGKDYAIRRVMLAGLLKEFRKRQWPFIVSPYEADGQLSYLANTGGVDLVVTEDSDLIALGVPKLVYKLGGWNGRNTANRSSGPNYFGNTNVVTGVGLRGTLLQRSDLGSAHDINLQDFSDAMLATMFVAAGCDYCDSLKGIGIITARNIIKNAFHGGEASDKAGYSRSENTPALRKILNDLFASCHRDSRAQLLPLDDTEKEEVRAAYERRFLAALAMFRHPLVYDPMLGTNIISNDVSRESDASAMSASFLRDEKILMEYQPYNDLVTNRGNLYEVIGTPFSPEVAKGIAEGAIDPRQLPAREEENEEGDEEPPSDTHGSGTGTQQSTQQSKSSGSGMISSLSPDLLASP